MLSNARRAPRPQDQAAAVPAPRARTTWEIVGVDGHTETVQAFNRYVDRGVYWFFDGGHWQDAHTTYPLANVFRCTRVEDVPRA